MRCHQEMHAVEGMAMIWDEASHLQPPLPPGFSTCNDFEWSSQQFEHYLRPVTSAASGQVDTSCLGVPIEIFSMHLISALVYIYLSCIVWLDLDSFTVRLC